MDGGGGSWLRVGLGEVEGEVRSGMVRLWVMAGHVGTRVRVRDGLRTSGERWLILATCTCT